MFGNPWGFFTMDVGGIWGEDAFLRGAARRLWARRTCAFAHPHYIVSSFSSLMMRRDWSYRSSPMPLPLVPSEQHVRKAIIGKARDR
jgi:hypothetical protein